MRITFDLEQQDIARFNEAMERVREFVRSADELDIIEAAKQVLDGLPLAACPSYVRKRLAQIQRLIVMLEDDEWTLGGEARADIVKGLVYFSDPDDLIPDGVRVIGLLDDAIMLELLLRRQRHVLEAYDDFCAFRATLDADAALAREERARRLARRRAALHARMRRRMARTLF
ncbi:MAG TPA: YkvA family protein [Gammaproteobacteria bacterium]|nr:YkvA family protein [Gammaproteobacteria bacterium]